MTVQYGKIVEGVVDEVRDGAFDGAEELPPGVTIGWSYDGQAFTPPPPPPLEDERDRVLAAIDARAGAERRKYISDLPGQVDIYMIKEAEAQALLNDPAADTPYLRAEAATTGLALNDVRDRVLANATTWRALSIDIEARRMGLKADAAAAGDHAALAVVESVINMGWTMATLEALDAPPV